MVTFVSKTIVSSVGKPRSFMFVEVHGLDISDGA